MQIVRMQCPACGAPLTVAADERATVCSFCRTQLAVIGGSSQPMLRPASLPPATSQPPTAARPRNRAEISNLRGCAVAAVMWFFGGPLLVMLLLVPVVQLFPSDADGGVLLPDALATCIGLLFFALPIALAIYGFVYFRQRDNGFWGFLTTPVRAIVHGLRRLRR